MGLGEEGGEGRERERVWLVLDLGEKLFSTQTQCRKRNKTGGGQEAFKTSHCQLQSQGRAGDCAWQAENVGKVRGIGQGFDEA